jgi:hypothetical protein
VICLGVDRPGAWWTEPFMENPTLIRASLSDVSMIMVLMGILVVELQCQVVTGQILALECLLSGVRGHMWSCLVWN